jgi:hypothetical protein
MLQLTEENEDVVHIQEHRTSQVQPTADPRFVLLPQAKQQSSDFAKVGSVAARFLILLSPLDMQKPNTSSFFFPNSYSSIKSELK